MRLGSALQLGDVNKVVPVDKSSTVLTILLALIFLHEGINVPKAAAAAMIAAGIYLMIEKKDKWMGANGDRGTGSGGNSRKGWMLYAAGSSVSICSHSLSLSLKFLCQVQISDILQEQRNVRISTLRNLPRWE